MSRGAIKQSSLIDLTNPQNCAYNGNMNTNIVAIIIQEGSKLVSDLIRNYPMRRVKQVGEVMPATMTVIEAERAIEEETVEESKATSVEAGCVPCAIGHLGTCSGLLNEMMRFAKKDGVGSSEVIDRVNMCLDELNAMERVDLRPELIAQLPTWEKELANKALTVSRSTRHGLEEISTVGQLEKVAATTQTARQEIGRTWFKERLGKMSKEERTEVVEKAVEKLKEEEIENAK